MIVNHRYKFIFLRTEKTAGTSLYSVLKAISAPEDLVANRNRPAWAKHSPIPYGALQRTMPKFSGRMFTPRQPTSEALCRQKSGTTI